MIRENLKTLEGSTVPLSYALTGFFVVLPVFSYEAFFYYHVYLTIKEIIDPDITVDLDGIDVVMFAIMGIGQAISLYCFFKLIKENIRILLVHVKC